MNDRIRQTVKHTMKQRGLTQDKLADMTNMERVHVNALVNGRHGKIPERWQRLLDALGLELIAVSKDRETDHGQTRER